MTAVSDTAPSRVNLRLQLPTAMNHFPLYFCDNKIRSICATTRAILRRWSAAPRWLRLRIRIPPAAWMSVSCECCMLSGRGLCDGQITRPEESYWVCVCVYVCLCVCVSLSMIMCNITLATCSAWVEEVRIRKKERKKERRKERKKERKI